MEKSDTHAVFRHLRLVHLLASTLVYLLGAGLARYLGEKTDGMVLGLGLIWLVCAQVGFYLLGDHFQTPFDAGWASPKLPEGEVTESEATGTADAGLYGSVALLAASAFISLILGLRGRLEISSGVLMGLCFGLFALIVVPGISLDLSGLGEIITSTILVVLPSALAFSLQAGSLHRSLPLAVFPLYPLHLAMVLLLRLSRYREDLELNHKTLLVRIGWIQGVFIHNLLLLSGFLLFGVSLIFGMSYRIIAPVFLALPAAIALVWYLSRFKDGIAVRWPLLKVLSLVVFFLPAYLITFSLWIR
jgi:1,4-dihydroxy-2-naphthoate octaprenyltransferase